MNRYAQALATPFNAETAEKIAAGQFYGTHTLWIWSTPGSSQLCILAYLDEIQDLQDPDLFYGIIEKEVSARFPVIPSQSRKKQKPEDPLQDAAKVATVVSTRCACQIKLDDA